MPMDTSASPFSPRADVTAALLPPSHLQRLHLRGLQTTRGRRIHQHSVTEPAASSLMNKGTDEERSPDVDVRPNAGIVRSPLDEIKAIQALLADVYKDAGDGRTLFRELVQNAGDAGAQQLGLVVLERGWPDARNSLLRGPALLVASDGAFTKKDREALHKAIGGSKEDEVGKIGNVRHWSEERLPHLRDVPLHRRREIGVEGRRSEPVDRHRRKTGKRILFIPTGTRLTRLMSSGCGP